MLTWNGKLKRLVRLGGYGIYVHTLKFSCSHQQPSWEESGCARHVMARNYTGAPRFCPGYHLSMKVAKDVCAQMTKARRQAVWLAI